MTFTKGPWIIPSPEALLKIESITGKQEGLKIGVAPFARHKLKIWPEEYMISLLKMISDKYQARFFLFGGNEEKEMLSAFQTRIEGSVNTNGLLNLDEELALMSRLDLMIAMDSSNMHMAALRELRLSRYGEEQIPFPVSEHGCSLMNIQSGSRLTS